MAITERYASASGAGAQDGTSEANAWSWSGWIAAVNALGAGGGAGLRINYKGDVSRTTNSDALSVGGTATSPLILRGYASVIGDGYQGRTNGNGPLIATNFPVVSYTTGKLQAAPSFVIIESMSFTSACTTATSGTLQIGADAELTRSVVVNTANNANCRAVRATSTGSVLRDCDISYTGGNASAAAIEGPTASNIQRLIGCRVTAEGAIGWNTTSGTSSSFYGCTFFNCAAAINVSTTGNVLVLSSTFVNCTTGIALSATSTSRSLVESSLFTDCGTAINFGLTTTAVLIGSCRFDRNTTNIANSGDWVTATNFGQNTTSATQSNEFENYGGNDFRLKSGSPAREIGLPAYRDIGALQHQDSGSGGGMIGGGNLNGGFQ